jgi:hypothetical protein
MNILAVFWIRINLLWVRIQLGWILILIIRIQSEPRVLMTKNWKKVYNWKKFLNKFFLSKIAIYLSLGLHKGRPSYRRSLQPSKENQHLKTWNFFTFLYFCRSLCPPGSGSETNFFGSVFFWYGSGHSILGWIPTRIPSQSGSRVLMTKNWKKITAENKKYNFFYQKTTVYLSLGFHTRFPSNGRSLQPSKENIQHFKT